MSSPIWQDSLDLRLMQRLLRRLEQPGILKAQISNGILNRTERFAQHLSFGQQLAQRYRGAVSASTNDIPIVYAQPLLVNHSATSDTPSANAQPTPSSQRTVIQAKFVSSSPLIQPILQTPPSGTVSSPITNPITLTTAPSPHPHLSRDHELRTFIEQESNPYSVNPLPASPQSPIANPQRLETLQIPLVYANYRSPNDLNNLAKSDRPSTLPTVTPIPSTPPPALNPIPLVKPVMQAQRNLSSLASPERITALQAPMQTPNRRNPSSTDLPLANARVGSATEGVSSVTGGDRPSPTVSPTPRLVIQPSHPQVAPGKWNGTMAPFVFSNNQPNRSINATTVSPELPGQGGLKGGFSAGMNGGFTPSTHPTVSPRPFPGVASTNGQSSEAVSENIAQRPQVTPPAKLDMEAIADQVERKLMRRLIVERERRGQSKWR
jgi:hypothetical protein